MSKDLWTHPDREFSHQDARFFCKIEMTKLVNENDHSKNNNKGNKLHRSICGFLSISSVLEQAQEMHQGKDKNQTIKAV